MTPREVTPQPINGGTIHQIEHAQTKATLFIPDQIKASQNTPLWVHFHTADWFVISEFQRAKLIAPVLTFNLGQGSATYGKPFTSPNTLQPFIASALSHLNAKKADLHFTSFSAGYGAVRNLIQDPEIISNLKTVILCDSSYAGFSDPVTRTIQSEHLSVWQPLIDRAIKGQITFVITTSQITPNSYASTWEVAQKLVKQNDGQMEATGNIATTNNPYPLLSTFNKGRWHVWCYDGYDAMAHMVHPRRLAEIISQIR
jgi:hypothetical protein